MVEVQARHELTPAEIGDLEDRLYAFNVEQTGLADGAGLAFVIEDEGVLIGAVAGYSWGGICEVRQLWVDAARRGQGLGAALIEAAIAEATARGCVQVLLATYDFQAPGFYARHGFEELARIPDKPVGHTEFILRRRLP